MSFQQPPDHSLLLSVSSFTLNHQDGTESSLPSDSIYRDTDDGDDASKTNKVNHHVGVDLDVDEDNDELPFTTYNLDLKTSRLQIQTTPDDINRSSVLSLSTPAFGNSPATETVAAASTTTKEPSPDKKSTESLLPKAIHDSGNSQKDVTKADDHQTDVGRPRQMPTPKKTKGEEVIAKKDTHYCPLVTSVETNKRYNFMVAGGSGAGKSTFCHTTFRRHFPNFNMPPPDGPTEQIGECGRGEKFDEDNKERILVTVIDTVGGFSSTEHINPILEYLERQHEEYERQELFRRPNERAHQDTRIVCLFYFFGPHRVHDDDIRFLASLHDKVPIVPIVAKADSLDAIELGQQLRLVRTRLAEANIQYFDFEEVGLKEDWLNVPFDPQAFTNLGFVMAAAAGDSASQQQQEELPAPVRPMVRNVFAVISNRRQYMWGTATPDNPRHSDTMRLHTALFGSLGRLADKMDEIHEQWRDERNRRCRFWAILCRLESVVAFVLFAAAVAILTVFLTGKGNFDEGFSWNLFEFKPDDVACFTRILAENSDDSGDF